MDQVALRRRDLHAVAFGVGDAPGGGREACDGGPDLVARHFAGAILVAVEEVEEGRGRQAVLFLRLQAGVGSGAGVAELDDVAAVGARLDLAHRLAQRRHEALVVEGRVFERRHPLLVDADRGRDDAGDAALGETPLEMDEGRGHRAVVKAVPAAHRGAQDAIGERDVANSTRLAKHGALASPIGCPIVGRR